MIYLQVSCCTVFSINAKVEKCLFFLLFCLLVCSLLYLLFCLLFCSTFCLLYCCYSAFYFLLFFFLVPFRSYLNIGVRLWDKKTRTGSMVFYFSSHSDLSKQWQAKLGPSEKTAKMPLAPSTSCRRHRGRHHYFRKGSGHISYWRLLSTCT